VAGCVLGDGSPIAGDLGTEGIAPLAQGFFDVSSQPKKLVLLDTADHGAEMLRGSRREEARAAVFDRLERYLPI
jgi:hypothetical protein